MHHAPTRAADDHLQPSLRTIQPVLQDRGQRGVRGQQIRQLVQHERPTPAGQVGLRGEPGQQRAPVRIMRDSIMFACIKSCWRNSGRTVAWTPQHADGPIEVQPLPAPCRHRRLRSDLERHPQPAFVRRPVMPPAELHQIVQPGRAAVRPVPDVVRIARSPAALLVELGDEDEQSAGSAWMRAESSAIRSSNRSTSDCSETEGADGGIPQPVANLALHRDGRGAQNSTTTSLPNVSPATSAAMRRILLLTSLFMLVATSHPSDNSALRSRKSSR